MEEVRSFCSVRDNTRTTKSVISHTPAPPAPRLPETFWDVLEEWGSTWLWDSLRLVGNDDWLAEAIADNSCMAVTDGSFIRELYPNMNSAAFVFECTKGRGRLIGSFSEQALAACAYRGELLGLMAIHLILLSVNRVRKELKGSVHIYSDCLGALNRVKHLPPHRIPTRCKHSDILKNILVNCSDLSFERIYSHVSAHQDDDDDFHELERPAQWNCAMDFGAKKNLWDLDPEDLPRQEAFPHKPICMFVKDQKMTSDTGDQIRFHAHRDNAKDVFFRLEVLNAQQVEEVA